PSQRLICRRRLQILRITSQNRHTKFSRPCPISKPQLRNNFTLVLPQKCLEEMTTLQMTNDERKQRSVVFCCPWSVAWQRERASAFTLLELLIVVGIIGLLLVWIAPAFTTIKGGTDVTSAAYTIKGVLDTARTYAKANNTYTWVGFYEENVANPTSPNSSTPAVGRVIMSIVASKDGTTVYDPNNL